MDHYLGSCDICGDSCTKDTNKKYDYCSNCVQDDIVIQRFEQLAAYIYGLQTHIMDLEKKIAHLNN